ncbi:ORF3 [torque teno Delphinidae virus 4]
MLRLRSSKTGQRSSNLRIRNGGGELRGDGTVSHSEKTSPGDAQRRSPGGLSPYSARQGYHLWTTRMRTVSTSSASSLHEAAGQASATTTRRATGAAQLSVPEPQAARTTTYFQGGFGEVLKLYGPIIRSLPVPLNPSPLPPINAFSFKLR